MNTTKRGIAVMEMIFVFPATLFMAALFLRELQPAGDEPAHSARRLVDWFSAHPPIGLDIFLVAMPLTALMVGCITVVRSWRRDAELRQTLLELCMAGRAHLATLLIAGATLMAASILAIVALHMITE